MLGFIRAVAASPAGLCMVGFAIPAVGALYVGAACASLAYSSARARLRGRR